MMSEFREKIAVDLTDLRYCHVGAVRSIDVVRDTVVPAARNLKRTALSASRFRFFLSLCFEGEGRGEHIDLGGFFRCLDESEGLVEGFARAVDAVHRPHDEAGGVHAWRLGVPAERIFGGVNIGVPG